MLFHGTNLKLVSLQPQGISSPKELQRVNGSKSALFATEFYEEALVYGISKALKMNGHAGYGKNDERWLISLPFEKESIQKDIPIYVYSFEETYFKKSDLNEWYTDQEISVLRETKLTIGEALLKFDEVRFNPDFHDETHRESERWL